MTFRFYPLSLTLSSVLTIIFLTGCGRKDRSSISTDEVVKSMDLVTPLVDSGQKDNASGLPIMMAGNTEGTLTAMFFGPPEKLNNLGFKFKLHARTDLPFKDLPDNQNAPMVKVKELVTTLAGKDASALISLMLTSHINNPKPDFKSTNSTEFWDMIISCEDTPDGFLGKVFLTPKR